MLELRGVTFAYPALAMRFDLTVAKGSFTAIIGPSGGGKSTLLSLIAGFETPPSGTILIDGRDVTGLPPAARPLTMIFQDHNLFAHLDVYTNVALGISPSLKLSVDEDQRIRTALADVGLSGKDRRLPGALSGGERQRVAIARALLRDRPLLLLDEPFTALGPALRQEMLEQIVALHRSRGLTTLMVTHHPEDARKAASHTAFLAGGRIVAYKPTAQLLKARDVPGLADYLGQSG
jgi:thiamine transport system ATP-binding protein